MPRCDWNDDVHVVTLWAVWTPPLRYKNNRGKQRLLIPSFKDLTILTVIFTFRLRSK